MTDQYDIHIGSRIKLLRKQKGLTLRELSERSGLSMNAISRMENGQTSPTVSSVHRLAMALGLPIAALFDESIATETVFVRSGERKALTMKGRRMEPLGTGMVDNFSEPFTITLASGEKSLSGSNVHPGEEFAYCLEGEVIFFIGEKSYHLRPGDSLFFKSSQPHSWENPAHHPARLLLIFVNPKSIASGPAEGKPDIINEYILQADAVR